MNQKEERDFSNEDRLRAERLKKLIEPAEKDVREGRVTPVRKFLKEFKAKRFINLCILISMILLGAQGVACSNPACPGPRHLHKKTKFCIYDVKYPELSNPEMACKVRNWIDLQMKEFGDGPELDPEMHKPNEFWIDCELFRSGNLESVYIENYEYGQGANGMTEIQTTTYDARSGKEFDIFDVIDMSKEWYGAVAPYAEKLMNEEGSQVIITREKAKSGLFKHFVIDKDDLIFFFEEYAVGPHSNGIVRLWVPLHEIKKVLKPAFISRYLQAKSPEAKPTEAPGKRSKSLDPLFP